MRRLLAVVAVSSAVVALVAGCSSSSSPSSRSSTSSSTPPTASAESPSSASPSSSKQADEPLPDSVALLKESSATTKDLKSAHLLLSVLGKVPELPVQKLKGELTNEPGPAAKGTATVTVLDSDLDAKFVVFGGQLYAALHGDDWNDYGPTSKVYDVTAVLNPETGLANMLDDFIDPKAEARETVRGQQTIRIAGKVTADAVNKVVPQLHATKRMPATVWIQEGGAHQVVQIELEPSKGNTIQMAFSDWNAPVVVEKPPVP